jgi:hypothetical protein
MTINCALCKCEIGQLVPGTPGIIAPAIRDSKSGTDLLPQGRRSCDPWCMSRLPRQASPRRTRQMRVAVYARVSTANNGQSPEMQLREINEYCDRRGWTVAGKYVDVGISGAKEKRPELDRLITNAHRRRVERSKPQRMRKLSRRCARG